MSDEEASAAEEVSVDDLRCESCGGRLAYSPTEDALRCDFCGHGQPMDAQAEADLGTWDFDAAAREAARRPAAEWMPKAARLSCQGCGAALVTSLEATTCPFCDTPLVKTTEPDPEDPLVPQALVPFRVEHRNAAELFKSWVGSRWFAPNDLQHRAMRQRIDGVYLPHWTFDGRIDARYRGLKGRAYTVEIETRDREGKKVRKSVRRIRWRPTRGRVRMDYADEFVCASKSIPRELARKVRPFHLGDARTFDSRYLAGFGAERYGISLRRGFSIAAEALRPRLDRRIRADIGGDAQRVTKVDAKHQDVAFRHLLLPIWISSFRYGDRVYRFVVNAQSGRVVGERPYSPWKIAAAVAAAASLAALIYWLRSRSG